MARSCRCRFCSDQRYQDMGILCAHVKRNVRLPFNGADDGTHTKVEKIQADIRWWTQPKRYGGTLLRSLRRND